MSGIGLIAGETAVGLHMATRLEAAFRDTDNPLRSVLVIERARLTRRQRLGRRIRTMFRRASSLDARVAACETEARALLEREAGVPPAWPDGAAVRRVSSATVNDADTVSWQKAFGVSVIVLVAAPIIRPPMLAAASLGVLNLHGSLLPHYRGTRTEVWQLRNGDFDKVGLTIHFVDPGLDTGDIVMQVPQAATQADGPWVVRARNQLAALDAMPKAVSAVLDGTVQRRSQMMETVGRTYRASDLTPDVLKQTIDAMNRESA